jgi:hypothetical protein
MTGIFTFTRNADTYNQDKQIQAIQEQDECNIVYKIQKGGLEKLDEAIIDAAAEGCDKLVVLLREDIQFEPLESAIHNEYGHFFEEIEVIPEGFERLIEQHLQEGPDPASGGGGPIEVIIFPSNAPLTLDFSAFITRATTVKGRSPNYRVLNWQPQNLREACFCKNASQLSWQFLNTNVKGWVEGRDDYAPSLASYEQYLDRTGYTVSKLWIPQGIPAPVASASIPTTVFQTDTTLSLTPVNNSTALYKNLVQISKDIADKSVKANEQAINTWLGDVAKVNQVQYIVELMVQAQDTLTNYGPKSMGPDERAKMLKDLRVRTLNNLGVTADLGQMMKSFDDHGIPLSSIVKIATDIHKTHKDMKEKKKEVDNRELIVSHKLFQQTVAMIPSPILEQEGAKNVVALRKKSIADKKSGDDTVAETTSTTDDRGPTT